MRRIHFSKLLLISSFLLFTLIKTEGQKKVIINNDSAEMQIHVFGSSITLDTGSSVKKTLKIDPYLIFDYDTIVNKPRFSKLTFNGSVQFLFTQFQKGALFDHVNFIEESDFYNSAYTKPAFFTNSGFSKNTGFHFTNFKDSVHFFGSTFSGNASFFTAQFSKQADFRRTRFSKNVDFSFANFSDTCSIDFDKAIFGDSIDFSYVTKIPQVIDLTLANFNDSTRYDSKGRYKRHIINLYKANIARFHIDYIHFKLALPDVISNRRLSNDEKDQVYEGLLNDFKIHGQDESYKLLDIEYQKFKWKNNGASFLIWLPRWWWNFGYDKEYIFLWVLGLIVIFTIINFFFIEYLNSEVYDLQNIPKSMGTANLGKRLWYSFVYSSTIFFKLTLELDKIKFKKPVGTIYLIFIYIVGIICLAYMANFVLQK